MKKFFKRLLTYLLDGIIIVVPVCATIFLVIYPLDRLSRFFKDIFDRFFLWFVVEEQGVPIPISFIKKFIVNQPEVTDWLIWFGQVPFVNLLFVLFLIFFVGLIASNFVIKLGVRTVERIFLKMPLLNLLYSYIKESTAAFFGKFNKPVLVLYNRELGIKKIGFITQKNLKALPLTKEEIAVFLPHSYAFSGELCFFPKEHIQSLNISTSDAMKITLSGGLAEIKRSPGTYGSKQIIRPSKKKHALEDPKEGKIEKDTEE